MSRRRARWIEEGRRRERVDRERQDLAALRSEWDELQRRLEVSPPMNSRFMTRWRMDENGIIRDWDLGP